jgi:lysophospholipase L1-like esterase
MLRLPVDTWTMAQIPAGVRLEATAPGGDLAEVVVDYECAHESFGYLGGGEGHSFVLLVDGEATDVRAAEVGRHTVTLDTGGRSPGVVTVHLPERMGPTIHRLAGRGVAGDEVGLTPAPDLPRWLCYGDSIAEGWCVTSPERAWPAIAAREQGLDVVNLGYAGSARGELPSAEEIADLDAAVISIAHGTNCWTRTPHSAALFAANLEAFLDIVRDGHPDTPVVAVSPITRPDAESTPNRLGTTLTDLRAAFEAVVTARLAADPALHLVEGLPIVDPGLLTDDIHPGDDGHAAMAATIGPALSSAMTATGAG